MAACYHQSANWTGTCLITAGENYDLYFYETGLTVAPSFCWQEPVGARDSITYQVTYTWFNTSSQQVGLLWGDGTPPSSSTDCATDPGALWTPLEVGGPVDSGMDGAAYLGIDFVVSGSGSTPSQGISLYWQVLTDPADAGGAEIVIQEL